MRAHRRVLGRADSRTIGAPCVLALRALEDALLEFAGCAVVITHDRWFLDRVATHILAFEGNSETIWFEGSWGDYVDWMKETRGPDALEPHRIKYKPLVRG